MKLSLENIKRFLTFYCVITLFPILLGISQSILIKLKIEEAGVVFQYLFIILPLSYTALLLIPITTYNVLKKVKLKKLSIK